MMLAPNESGNDASTVLQSVIGLIEAVLWPAVILICLRVFHQPLLKILWSFKDRIDAGDSIEIYQVKVGQAPTTLSTPSSKDKVTADHMALIHSSWRYPQKDIEFGRPMWAFHVVIQAREEVLNRIESAKYSLHPSYPNPIQVITDRLSRFKLKELAYGESSVRCDVKVKGQDETIHLERYINLTNTGPRI